MRLILVALMLTAEMFAQTYGSSNAAVTPTRVPPSMKRGNGTKFQMTTGTVATDDCAKFDSNGNVVSAGAACAGVTIQGTANQIDVTGTSTKTIGFPSAVDMSTLSSVIPWRTGTSLPGTCSVGQVYFKTDATAGQNIYTCTSSNTWTQVVGTGGGVSSVSGTSNEIASTGGSTPTLSIASTFDISGKTSTKPFKSGISAPATCTTGEAFFDTDAVPGQNLFLCTSANVWTLVGSISTGATYVTSKGSATSWTVLGAAHAFGECRMTVDIFTTSGGVETKIEPDSWTCDTANENVTVNFATAQAGIIALNKGGGSGGGGGGGGGTVTLVSGTANEIDVADGATTPTLTLSATLDLSGKTSVLPMPTGTSLPGTCSIGMFYFKTDAAAGSNIYACTGVNTWTVQAGGGGGSSEPLGYGLRRSGGFLEVNPSTVLTYLAFTQAYDFPSISQSSCATTTITVSGASPGDKVAPAIPQTKPAGLTVTMYVSDLNTVTVEVCKITSGSVDMGSLSWGGYVLKSF